MNRKEIEEAREYFDSGIRDFNSLDDYPHPFISKYYVDNLKILLSLAFKVLAGELVENNGFINADEVTLEFFRKYLKMPKATLEDMCRKISTLVEPMTEAEVKNILFTIEAEDKKYFIPIDKVAKALISRMPPDKLYTCLPTKEEICKILRKEATKNVGEGHETVLFEDDIVRAAIVLYNRIHGEK